MAQHQELSKNDKKEVFRTFYCCENALYRKNLTTGEITFLIRGFMQKIKQSVESSPIGITCPKCGVEHLVAGFR